MDADSPVESDAPETLQWRRDATTSRTIRLLWSLGVGTFFAMISIIAFWRVYDLAAQAGIVDWLVRSIPGFRSIVGALVAAVVVTIVAIALSSDSERYLERLVRPLPVSTPSKPGLRRLFYAVFGTLVMTIVIVSLLVAGRIAARPELLGEGGESPFTGLAAATIPLALIALVLASFFRSVGALDPDEGVIYLYDPEQAIDLSVIDAVSVRAIGDAVAVTIGPVSLGPLGDVGPISIRPLGDLTVVALTYAQPDGQYVPGPRRLVVPSTIASAIRSAVYSHH